MDVILDTDIASTFGKVRKFYLLERLFPNSTFYISSAVKEDLERASKAGYDFVRNVTKFVGVVSPDKTEEDETGKILSKGALGKGEAESIAIAKNRKILLLTNDKIATREAQKMGVETMNLPAIIRQLWKYQVLSKESARDLISEIEEKDNIKFVGKEMIFED